MKYKTPEVYRVFPSLTFLGACASGDMASSPPSCSAGPEAGAGGCGAGAAAASRCLAGAAAGTKCATGTCFE